MRNRLILASASPRRLALLQQIGITPDAVMPAEIDESAQTSEKPRDYALRMALEKGRKIADQKPGVFVLAADTVVAAGRRILPKTDAEAEARACLELLSGRRHRVYGGICLITPGGKTMRRVSETAIRMKTLSRSEIESYLHSGQWRGVAGGYAIQGMAAAFIKTQHGSYSNVVGLCVYDTMQLLTGAGFFKT